MASWPSKAAASVPASLAMAARARLDLYAHDADPGRMRDLPARAERAGARISISKTPEKTAPYDLILTDVPCSGSGSWRRDPMGKWALTPERLSSVCALQSQILARAAAMLAFRAAAGEVSAPVFTSTAISARVGSIIIWPSPKATRGDIRGNQNLKLIIPEPLKRSRTDALLQIAMNGRSVKTVYLQ